MTAPSTIWQGDTVEWNDPAVYDASALETYDSATATLTYYIAGPSAGFSVAGVADGSGGWDFTISAVASAALVAGGTYSFQRRVVTAASKKITLGEGQILVRSTMETAPAGFDARSQTEIDLEACQAAIRARINGQGVAEYSIGTRRLRYETMEELRKMAADLSLRVRREKRAADKANGKGDFRTLHVRF